MWFFNNILCLEVDLAIFQVLRFQLRWVCWSPAIPTAAAVSCPSLVGPAPRVRARSFLAGP